MNKQETEITRLIRGSIRDGFAIVGESFLPTARKFIERENRSFGRGMIAGSLITAFVGIVIGLGIFFSYQAAHTSPPKDTIEQQLNDTVRITHSPLEWRESSDGSLQPTFRVLAKRRCRK